ncbi:cation:proton antiporter [Mycoplasmatota bacterium WC44]
MTILSISAILSSSVEAGLLESLQGNIIFMVSLLIIFGVIGGMIVDKIGFPKVTGYILMGLIVGPSLLGIFTHHMIENFRIIRQVAIGFIGYTIGLELRLSKIRNTGKQVTIITFVQALVTAILVCLAIVLVVKEHKWTYGLILGAIATATAPGPIIAVVKGYKCKGPVTDVLLPLVALDDAIGIMLFAVLLSFGTALLNVTGEVVGFVHMIMEPLREIGISLIAGAAIGFALQYILKRCRAKDANDDLLLLIIISALFFGIGFGLVVHASAILLPMTIGIVLTNSVEPQFEHKLTKISDLFGAPILLSFFIIAGAELQVDVLRTIGLVGVVYIVVRVVGKVVGSYTSAKAVKAPPTVVKYLGWTLIPQAGVAIDMALTVDLKFKPLSETVANGAWIAEIGTNIMTIVLAATVIYEVFGLIVVKNALQKAGEINTHKSGETNKHNCENESVSNNENPTLNYELEGN